MATYCTKTGGQVTKPIILVKICYKLLYVTVIQGVENSFGKVTSWPQLILEFWLHMPVNNVASDWPRTFLCPSHPIMEEIGITNPKYQPL